MIQYTQESSRCASAVLCAQRFFHYRSLKIKCLQRKNKAMFAMLYLFCKNPKQVLARQRLLEKLWDVEEEYVDWHALLIVMSRKKLAVFTSALCGILDSMINGGEPGKMTDGETLFTRVFNRLSRFYQILMESGRERAFTGAPQPDRKAGFSFSGPCEKLPAGKRNCTAEKRRLLCLTPWLWPAGGRISVSAGQWEMELLSQVINVQCVIAALINLWLWN